MREYPFTEARHERWLAEGRGSGDGATWNPWLHRGDFSSVGKAAIDSIEGADGREIHVFSALERLVWMLYSPQPSFSRTRPIEDAASRVEPSLQSEGRPLESRRCERAALQRLQSFRLAAAMSALALPLDAWARLAGMQ